MNLRLSATLMMLCTLTLAACDNSQQLEAERVARRSAQMEAEAAERLANLRQMQSIGRDDLALTLADDLLQRFPDTNAAREAQPMVETLRAKVQSESEARRLKELWVYHSGHDADAGGVVRSAYLYSSNTLGDASDGAEPPRARLVFRRHPQWGDDVYLLTDRGKFSCGTPCTVQVQFDDGDAVTYPAKLPETGEPAMFVEDFKRFVATVPDADRVRFNVTLDDGSQHVPEFELGGYESTTIGRP